MLSSSWDALLKLSKTTSPKNCADLILSHCKFYITIYESITYNKMFVSKRFDKLSSWILHHAKTRCTWTKYVFTVWCNQMGTVFAEMSSLKALTRHIKMMTTFYTKNMNNKYVRICIIIIFILYNIIRKCILTQQ